MTGKLIKFTVAALVALFILVVGGVGLVLLAFDPNQYKSALIHVVQERYHRSLALPGTIQLRLFPPFTLETGPMRLSEPGSDALFAQAADMRLHLDLLALIRRKIVVDRIALEAPRVIIQRDAQGRFNFDDLLPKPGAPDAEDTAGKPAPPLDLLVRSLSITDGDITLHDAKTGVAGRLAALNLELAGIGASTPGPMRLSARAVFTKPLLDTNFSLKGRLLAMPQGPLALQDFMLRSDGSVLGIKKLLTNVSGSLSYTAARGSPTPDPNTATLNVQAFDLKAQGQGAQGQPLQAEASLPQLSWTSNHIAVGAFEAKALLGAAPGTTRVTISAPATSGAMDKLQWPGFQLAVEQGLGAGAAGVHAKLHGNLSLNLRTIAAALDAARLQGTWQAARPGVKPLPLDLQGSMTYTLASSTASVDLAGLAGTSQIKLAGTSQKGAITLNASADRLDLDALLGTHATETRPPTATGAKSTAPAAPAQTPAKPIDLSALQALDLDARLQIGRLRFKGMQWSQLQMRVRDDRKAVTVDPFSLQGYGGSLSGTARVNLGTAHYTLTQTARNLQIQPIIQALSGRDFLLGTANGSLALDTQGKTSDALLRALSGTAQFEVRNGALKGFNLAQSLRDAGSLLRLRQDRQAVTSGTQQTDFTSLSVSFQIAQGVASSSDLSLQSPLLRVGGEGRFDLPAQTLDYVLRPTLVGTLAGQGGEQAAALKGLTVPVRISGPFAQPQYAVLWSQAAGGAIENAVKHRARQELEKRLGPNPQQQLRDRLQDKLKGLLP